MCCCDDSKCGCELTVTELEDGFKIELKGDKVKGAISAEELKKCIMACCAGKCDCKEPE